MARGTTVEDRFIVACPNEDFAGRRAGVYFEDGRAIVKDKATRDYLVKELGYADITNKES